MPKKTSAKARGTVIRAAGGVLWRPRADGSGPEVAVIHRPRYDDWTLPKGKVDPGESEPVAAVREIAEETGFAAVLGRFLTTVRYPLGRDTKRVRYWAARVRGGEFTPNEEVDEIRWLDAAAAAEAVGYPHDREVLALFAETPADTRTVLVVRHASAGNKSGFRGDDRLRPLDRRGRAQAEALVGQLLAFGASTVHAAPRTRCRQTVDPLAEEIGVAITEEPTLTEEAYAEDPVPGRDRMVSIAGLPGTPVVCTQGKVIPGLIGWWSSRDGITPDASRNRKGSTWVLSLIDGILVAADHLDSPLAED